MALRMTVAALAEIVRDARADLDSHMNDVHEEFKRLRKLVEDSDVACTRLANQNLALEGRVAALEELVRALSEKVNACPV